MKKMPVVILCGGKGMRLGEKTLEVPKPLIEIGGKPILWHVMKIYASQGFDDFILCLGYKQKEIVDYFKKNNRERWNILPVDTGLETTKSQRLEKVKKLISSEDFFLAYGDDVADIRLGRLLKHHKMHGPVCTISIVKLVSEYGIVVSSAKTGRITQFKEKPVLDEWMNGGFMVVNRGIFDYLNEGELEQEVFAALVKHKQIGAYRHVGRWKAMNTLKDYAEMTSLWDAGDAFWKPWKE
jgi:glucose-1-phosphate cytidylyltransferase